MELLAILLFFGPLIAGILCKRSSQYGDVLATALINLVVLVAWAFLNNAMSSALPRWLAVSIAWSGIIVIQASFLYFAIEGTSLRRDIDRWLIARRTTKPRIVPTPASWTISRAAEPVEPPAADRKPPASKRDAEVIADPVAAPPGARFRHPERFCGYCRTLVRPQRRHLLSVYCPLCKHSFR